MKKKMLYRRLKPGDCPFCGSGPIGIINKEVTGSILDITGSPVMSKNLSTSNIGICTKCKKVIGEYQWIPLEFRYVPKRFADKNIDIAEPVLAKLNFFGPGI